MNTSNSVDINGDKIRQLREQKELTQLYLATVVGVTTDTISRWENRRYPAIKLENARKLAEALEVPLEELLAEAEADAEGPVPETTGDEQRPAAVPAGGAGALFRRYRRWALLGAGALSLAAVAMVGLLVSQSAVRAVRIMPRHSAPSLAFPVLIQITGPMEATNPLLVREELTGDGQATGFSGEGAPKKFDRNPRWIGKLADGKAAFLYLVEPGKKLRPDETIRFSGDLVSREGQTTGETIGGQDLVVIAPYHWADSDQDYVISDGEILKAYETFSVPGENLINFNAIEELWMAGRYAWNKKTQTFGPAAQADGKE